LDIITGSNYYFFSIYCDGNPIVFAIGAGWTSVTLLLLSKIAGYKGIVFITASGANSFKDNFSGISSFYDCI
jgi:hypothetical protein